MTDAMNGRDDKPDAVGLSEFLGIGNRGVRFAGLIVIGAGVVYMSVTGDWLSGHSVLLRVVVGAAVGIALGLVLRFAIPRERRREFIRQNYPRLGARLPPLPERDDPK